MDYAFPMMSNIDFNHSHTPVSAGMLQQEAGVFFARQSLLFVQQFCNKMKMYSASNVDL